MKFKNKELALKEVHNVMDKAIQMWNLTEVIHLDLHTVPVTFDLKSSRSLGVHSCKICKASHESWDHKLRFNPQMLNDVNFQELINDTIPHEVAHLVCTLIFGPGQGHNKNWQHIAKKLGADPSTKSSTATLVSTTNRREFLYIVAGEEIRLTATRHNKILKGTTYIYNNVHRLSIKNFVREL